MFLPSSVQEWVWDAELSVRASKALNNFSSKRVFLLWMKQEGHLRKLPGVGPKTATEIQVWYYRGAKSYWENTKEGTRRRKIRRNIQDRRTNKERRE